MTSCGILAYFSAKRKQNSVLFFVYKTPFRDYHFQEKIRPCVLSFQALQRAVSSDLNYDALVKEIRNQIAKVSPLNFLDVDSNRRNMRASLKSLIPLPKVKTLTQKKSLRFSIIKLFN